MSEEDRSRYEVMEVMIAERDRIILRLRKEIEKQRRMIESLRALTPKKSLGRVK